MILLFATSLLISFLRVNSQGDWIYYKDRTVDLPKDFVFMSWNDALQRCQDLQAEPFIPYSAEDFKWMQQVLSKLTRKPLNMNFPMTDVDQEGTFKWSNGKAVPEDCSYLKMLRNRERNRGSTDYAYLTSEGIGWFSGTSTYYGMICEVVAGSPREFECNPKTAGNQSEAVPPTNVATKSITAKPTEAAPPTSVATKPTTAKPTEAVPTTAITAKSTTAKATAVPPTTVATNTTTAKPTESSTAPVIVTEPTKTKTSDSNMEEVKTDAVDKVTTEHIPTEVKTNQSITNMLARMAHDDSNVVTTEEKILSTEFYHNETELTDVTTEDMSLSTEIYSNQTLSTTSGSSTPMIAGLIVAILFIVALLAAVIFWQKKKKKKYEQTLTQGDLWLSGRTASKDSL